MMVDSPITTEIDVFPIEQVPSSSDESTFHARATFCWEFLPGLATDLNALSVEFNALAGEVSEYRDDVVALVPYFEALAGSEIWEAGTFSGPAQVVSPVNFQLYTIADGVTLESVLDPSEIGSGWTLRPPTSIEAGGTGGNSPATARAGLSVLSGVEFADHAAAEAATVDSAVRQISYLDTGRVVTFTRDPAGTDLTTDDGADWRRVTTTADVTVHKLGTVDDTDPDALVVTTGASLSALVTGMEFFLNIDTTNTGAMTVAVDGLSAVAVKTITGAATPAGYIRTDVVTRMYFDGTNLIADRAVETGSNGNGFWTRHADGNQTCYVVSVIGGAAGVALKTYPAAFASTAISVVASITGSATTSDIKVKIAEVTAGYCTFTTLNGASYGAVGFTYQAVGRWY